MEKKIFVKYNSYSYTKYISNSKEKDNPMENNVKLL